MTAVKEYDTRLDTKNRVTIRNARYQNYHIVMYDNGSILLEPRVLVPPFELSKNTLAMMDSAVKNLKAGNVSAPVDLSAFEELGKDSEKEN